MARLGDPESDIVLLLLKRPIREDCIAAELRNVAIGEGNIGAVAVEVGEKVRGVIGCAGRIGFEVEPVVPCGERAAVLEVGADGGIKRSDPRVA